MSSNPHLADFGLSAVVAANVDLPRPIGKPAWRALVRRRNRARDRNVATRHGAAAAEMLGNLAAYLDARVVALYSPLGTEVDTRPLANALLVQGRALVYPRLQRDGVTIDMCQCDGPANLAARPRSRLLEPVGAVVQPDAIDLVIVPAMAVTPQLARLGRGGGSYDRYLSAVSESVPVVALVAADCVIPWGPMEKHDAVVDAVMTENGLFVAAPRDV